MRNLEKPVNYTGTVVSHSTIPVLLHCCVRSQTIYGRFEFEIINAHAVTQVV